MIAYIILGVAGLILAGSLACLFAVVVWRMFRTSSTPRPAPTATSSPAATAAPTSELEQLLADHDRRKADLVGQLAERDRIAAKLARWLGDDVPKAP